MTNTVTVTDEHGVRWAVAEEDIECWMGNMEYALLRPDTKKVKVFDPNFVHDKRDFTGENPHEETVWEKQLVHDEDGESEVLVMQTNPLWEEWESSKDMQNRLGIPAAVCVCAILFLILLGIAMWVL